MIKLTVEPTEDGIYLRGTIKGNLIVVEAKTTKKAIKKFAKLAKQEEDFNLWNNEFQLKHQEK